MTSSLLSEATRRIELVQGQTLIGRAMKTVNHFLLIFLVQLFVDRDVVGQNLSCPSEKFVFLAMSDNCVQQFYACVSGVAHSQVW